MLTEMMNKVKDMFHANKNADVSAEDRKNWIARISENPKDIFECPDAVVKSVLTGDLVSKMCEKDRSAKLFSHIAQKMEECHFTEEQKKDICRSFPDWLGGDRGYPIPANDMFIAENKEIVNYFFDNFYFPKEMQTFIKFDENSYERVHENFEDYCLNLNTSSSPPKLTVDHGTPEGSVKLLNFDTNLQKEHGRDADLVDIEDLYREMLNNIKESIENKKIQLGDIPQSLQNKIEQYVPESKHILGETYKTIQENWLTAIKENPKVIEECPKHFLKDVFNENFAKELIGKDCSLEVCNRVNILMSDFDFTEEQKYNVYKTFPEWLKDNHNEALPFDLMKENISRKFLDSFIENLDNTNKAEYFVIFNGQSYEELHDNFEDLCLNMSKTGNVTLDHGTPDDSIKLLSYSEDKQKIFKTSDDEEGHKDIYKQIFKTIDDSIKNCTIDYNAVPTWIESKISKYVPNCSNMLVESQKMADKFMKSEYYQEASEIVNESNKDVLAAWNQEKDFEEFPEVGVKALCLDKEDKRLYIDYAMEKTGLEKDNVVVLETMENGIIHESKNLTYDIATILKEHQAKLEAQNLNEKLEQSDKETVKKGHSR